MKRCGARLFLLCCACGPTVATDDGATPTTSTGVVDTSTSGAATTTTTTAADASTTSTTSTSTTSSDETNGCPFICPGDTGDPPFECSQWDQDCPAGQKCTAWANDGGGSWNALKCVPVAEDPKLVGEACTVEGSGVSGIDDCERGAMCFDVDPETNVGTCYAFCIGNEALPVCPDASSQCNITGEGILTLCLPSCSPLVQGCDEGQGCYPVEHGFTCAPDASGPDTGVYGDACEYINVCDAGLFCDMLGGVPDCTGSLGCCNAFCDVTDPGASCPDVAQGQTCVAWYEPGTAPPGLQDVGRCTVMP
ncbi:MAG TPA: hypothetical protein VG755_20550 [Nannocystaceae bacterium]|nr:hypothetical protein [Nannocystaceae bacterium]